MAKASHKSPAIPGAFGVEGSGRYLSIPVDYDVRIVRVRSGVERAITRFVESIDWDPGQEGSGSLNARRTHPLDPDSLPVKQGDRVTVLYRDSFSRGPWKPEVSLQVDSPGVDLANGATSFTLDNPYVAFANVERSFLYRKDKHHKNGWKLHQLIIDACESVGAPYDREHIATGHATFPSPWKGDPVAGDVEHSKGSSPRSSLLAFINKCVRHEKGETGRTLIPIIVNGRLRIVDRGASGKAHVLDPSAQALSVDKQAKTRPPTVIRGFGRTGKGKDGKLKPVIVTAPLAIARYGFLIKEKDFGKVRSGADLKQQATRELAAGLRVVRTASCTIPGAPGLRPFDAISLRPPKHAGHGRISPEDFGVIDTGTAPSAIIGDTARGNGIAFIASLSHSISAGVWTTDLELQELDPWAPYREQLKERKVGYRQRKAKSPKPKGDSKKSPGTN